MNDVQLTRNFKLSEFQCKCNPFCGFDKISPLVVTLCQELRDFISIALRVNSGCRCDVRNRLAGSSSTNHTRGYAADLSCAQGHIWLWNQAKRLWEQGGLKVVDLVLLESSWVHIDVNGKRPSGVFQKL